jgi:hypothetical protein
MSRKFFVGTSVLLASSVFPLLADYTDLQPTAAAVENDRVIVQVDNPNAVTETARIQITVRVADGSIESLTVPTVTVQASSSTLVTASASATIVQIIDDPQPISP